MVFSRPNQMAGFRLPCLRSMAVSLNGLSSRFTSQQHQQILQQRKLQHLMKHRMMSSAASNLNLPNERARDKIVYSRHEHCFLHNQTVVQRFFEQASLWPNQVAMVSEIGVALENIVPCCTYKKDGLTSALSTSEVGCCKQHTDLTLRVCLLPWKRTRKN